MSLVTGLSDDVGWMDAHLLSGYAAIVLVLFRLGWALWGGRHSRLSAYRPSPRRLWAQMFGGDADAGLAHTPWGALLAVVLWTAVVAQVGTGLFASDDIFTEGPFARRVSGEAVDRATWIHVRLQWLILTLAIGHLLAIAWYALVRRDRLALAMFTGRKPGAAAEPRQRFGLALITLAGSAALLWIALEYF